MFTTKVDANQRVILSSLLIALSSKHKGRRIAKKKKKRKKFSFIATAWETLWAKSLLAIEHLENWNSPSQARSQIVSTIREVSVISPPSLLIALMISRESDSMIRGGLGPLSSSMTNFEYAFSPSIIVFPSRFLIDQFKPLACSPLRSCMSILKHARM